MEKTTIHVFKWFWAWEDYKEEIWLREMAQKGWHLASVGLPTVYTFSQGEPANYVYRLDYVTSSRKGSEDYYQLFQDSGWEHIGHMGGWQYFRKLARPGEEPEIFTDNESKVEKYKRVLLFLIAIAVALFPVYISVFRNSHSRAEDILEVIYVLLAGFYGFAIAKLIQRINQLRRR